MTKKAIKELEAKIKRRRAKKPPSMKSLGLRLKKKRVGDQIIDYAPASMYNAAKILQYHPKYENTVKRDTFALQNTINDKPIEDRHLLDFCYHAEDWYNITFSTSTALEGFNYVADLCSYDPLKMAITAKKWVPSTEKTRGMIDKWMIDFLGVEDTILHRIISRKFLIGAVGRALYSTVESPVKFDNCLILYGDQGRRKSSAIEALAIDRRWFADIPFDMTGKEFIQKITGKFLYELKELARRTKDKAAEKAFLDTKIDRLRLPYDKCVTSRPRRTTFIGSTNRPDLLSDSTGSRRFWVVEVCKNWKQGRQIDVNGLSDIALDLWREAHYEFVIGIKNNTPDLWWLSEVEEQNRIDAVELFNSRHPWSPAIIEICANLENRELRTYPVVFKGDFDLSEPIKIDRLDDGTPLINPNLIMKIMLFERREYTAKNRTQIEMILREIGYTRKRRRHDGKRPVNFEKETKNND